MLHAVVAVLVLESDVLEVDTSVYHPEHHAGSVIGCRETCRLSIGGECQSVVNVGGLTGIPCEDALEGRNVDALHVADTSHLLDYVDGDEGREQAIVELFLKDDALCLYLAFVCRFVQAEVGCDVGLAVDGVGRGIEPWTLINLWSRA